MKTLSAFVLAALAGTARACEGACIVGVTDVWLSNYTTVVQGVFDQTVRQPLFAECLGANLTLCTLTVKGNC